MKRVIYPCAGALVALVVALGLVFANDLGRPSVGHALMVLTLGAGLGMLGYRLGRREDALVVTSYTDALTGVANRRHLEARLAQEVVRAAESAMPLAILVLDLDDLKEINDRDGHAAGDKALSALGEVLAVTCRSRDLAARVGGDEFCVVMPRSTAAEAAVLAERIRAALVHRAPSVTVSIGAADLHQTGTREPATLFAAADHALYHAKRSGRDRVVVFHDEAPSTRRAFPSRCDAVRDDDAESGIRCTTPSAPPTRACPRDLGHVTARAQGLIAAPEPASRSTLRAARPSGARGSPPRSAQR